MLMRVKEWLEWFENAKSKTYRNKSQCQMPNKQGLGYKRLVKQPDGPAMFGVWCAMVQVLSRHTMRGGYLTEDGKKTGRPLGAGEIAELTLMPEVVCAAMLKACSTEEIGWLEVIDATDTARIPQGYCADTARIPQESVVPSVRLGLVRSGTEGEPRARGDSEGDGDRGTEGDLPQRTQRAQSADPSSPEDRPRLLRGELRRDSQPGTAARAEEVVKLCEEALKRLRECGPEWERLSLEHLVEMVKGHPKANLGRCVERIRQDWLGQPLPAVKTPPMIVRQVLTWDEADGGVKKNAPRGGSWGGPPVGSVEHVEALRMKRIGGG